MSDKFVADETLICEDWANQVDQLVYNVFDEATTDEEARLAIQAVEEVPDDGEQYVREYQNWVLVREADALTPLVLYLGAFATAPTTMNDGSVLVPGAMYLNTTTQRPYWWTGTFWSTFEVNAPAVNTALVYIDPGLSIDLSVADENGNTHALTSFETVWVFVNGARLLPYNGSIGDFTANVVGNSIDFEASTSGVVQVEIFSGTDTLSPVAANLNGIADLDRDWSDAPTYPAGLIDGVETVFTLYDADAIIPVSLTTSRQLILFRDDVRLEPDVDYTVVASTLTFTEAPKPDGNLWALYVGN